MTNPEDRRERRHAHRASIFLTAQAMLAFPGPALANGWETSSQTVWNLILPGAAFVVIAYIGHLVFWLSAKAGLSDIGSGVIFAGLHPEAHMTFLRVLRVAAFGAIGIGLFAWMVGWAKGTL